MMILSLTAIVVLSATLLFPLGSAFGQAQAPYTNIDGDTITLSVPPTTNLYTLTYTDSAEYK
ncbi:MAG: hypothetical protein R1F52_07790 [Candidatus Nitrosoabyssus spongiisocia]|nr:MAG: hypothetical protein R1F52_07790 [Nitrosopumilaceae archaeon AB1(1)]